MPFICSDYYGWRIMHSPVCERSHGFSNAHLLKYCITDYLKVKVIFSFFQPMLYWFLNPCFFGVLFIRGHVDLVSDQWSPYGHGTDLNQRYNKKLLLNHQSL